MKAGTVNYFTVTITDPAQELRITLFRSVDPTQTAFFPGTVLMGPDRLNIDKTDQYPNYFPNAVKVPVGYDTYVRFQNEVKDYIPIYVGLMPFSWYQLITFNATGLKEGLYVIAVFNSESPDRATDGSYALAIGRDYTLTFDDFMLGPFYAFNIYEWEGWHPALILLPYWVIIFLALIIIGHQTFWQGNSPRSYFSFFVVIGGYLTIGSGCVVIGQLAFSFLQVASPVSSSLTTIAITVAMFLGPIVCGILLVFFGLMHRANNLIRLFVLFFAVGACLVWASYYIGPGIAVIGAFLPSSKWIPFHRWCCCTWLRDIDDENRESTIKNNIDIDWEQYDDAQDKKQEAAKRAEAAVAVNTAAAKANQDADDDDIQGALSPEPELEAHMSAPSSSGSIVRSSTAKEEPFADRPPIHIVSEEEDEFNPALPATSAGVHQPQHREGIDD